MNFLAPAAERTSGHNRFCLALTSAVQCYPIYIFKKNPTLGDGAVNCADCGLCRLSGVFSAENSGESCFSSYQMQELLSFSQEQSTFGSARC